MNVEEIMLFVAREINDLPKHEQQQACTARFLLIAPPEAKEEDCEVQFWRKPAGGIHTVAITPDGFKKETYVPSQHSLAVKN